MDIQRYKIDRLLDEWEDRLRANNLYGYDEYSVSLDECIHDMKELVAESDAEEACLKDLCLHLPPEEMEYCPC